MNFNEYDENVRGWVDEVLSTRTIHSDRTKEYCLKIIARGKKDKDNKLLGFAHYYLAETFFYENEYKKYIKNLVIGLRYQQEASMDQLLARSYNMLGVNSDNQGNVPAAIDYYITSLKYSQAKGLEYEAGITNSNIGQVYATLKNYKAAILYLEKAITFWNTMKHVPRVAMNIVTIEAALATCYYHLGDLKSALEYFEKIEKIRGKYEEDTHFRMVVMVFEALIYQSLKEFEKRDERIEQLIHLVNGIASLMDLYDEAFALCDMLMELERYDDLWNVMDRIEVLTKQAGITNIQLRLLKLKIRYYQKKKNNQAYLHACSDYFKFSEKLENENKAMAKSAIELRIDLEHVREKQSLMQEENKKLLEKSERDPLTQLPNREKLNHYAEAAFEKAYHNQTSLGVEIFDIDGFKHYNDTYGHQAGDKILKKISQILQKLIDRGIFCARYGGDEFIIIYENMTDEQIMGIAQKLSKDVGNIRIKSKNSETLPVLTISQGIRNSVPRNMNKLWDYFYVADMTMYQVKRTTKNDIRLIHKPVIQQPDTLVLADRTPKE